MRYNNHPCYTDKGKEFTPTFTVRNKLGKGKRPIHVIKHRVLHKAWLDMGADLKDVYINGIAYSYVCVNRRGIKSRKASFARQKERSELHTNAIRVRFKPMNSKEHRLKHRGHIKTNKVQITTFY